ncbi:citrate synthase [Nonomuraea sp. MCN248]|uniref:citrate synthase (unknown stereospecificity) n=1 Tax=Nonomuraea corallina TaxID=2989783 RepID=A0ABT4SNI1_9ACTN|nr:citrate synthase [Nonomuraea corallina]MDA0638635.1 citrate synthase [Nonomuraea corallina]
MEWIDAATAADRLGVKPATLYAYVSRGVLKRRHEGRRSLFDAAEIETLARRGRPRGQPPELVIESAITVLGLDRPYYRGHDALTLARTATFETTAERLWTPDPVPAAPPPLRPAHSGSPASTGRLTDSSSVSPETGAATWEADAEAVRAAVVAQRGLPEPILPLDRLQVIVTVLGAADLLRVQLDPVSVAATGRRLIAGLVDALPAQASPEPARTGPIAGRLWTRLSPHPPSPALLHALEAALVLLADHELAASTLAARVAASARADPYAVVLTGLGVLSGPLHGGASYAAEHLLTEVARSSDAPRVIADWVRRGRRIPGFGHSVYKNGDARATTLLDLVAEAAPDHDRLAAARAVLAEARRRRLPEPNIDFALATLAAVAGLAPGAGEAVFAVARTAGWLAHAMEEYARDSLLRLRASYTGPPIPKPST